MFGTLLLPLTRISIFAFTSISSSPSSSIHKLASSSYSSTTTRLMGMNYILKYDYIPGKLYFE